MTTTGNLDPDVDLGELINAQEEDGLVQLRAENLGSEELEGGAVDSDQALAGHRSGNGCRSRNIVSNFGVQLSRKDVIFAHPAKFRQLTEIHLEYLTGGILLLAENLYCLSRHFESMASELPVVSAWLLM